MSGSIGIGRVDSVLNWFVCLVMVLVIILFVSLVRVMLCLLNFEFDRIFGVILVRWGRWLMVMFNVLFYV